MEGFGVQAIVNIIIQLVFIIVTWWALQTFRLDIFLKNPNSPQAKTLLILLTIAIGSLVGNFFINYLEWATRLRYLF
ncbi:DUF1146 domain-containing protein [Pueribacillus theae]|uniref:DUF1146 domain-containing protein n=1 Tax=Pueribacillus theae TaxID=2171751 RepID=A0A2U1K3W8_9BACI|nr:DUF1146 family protein [Pueribacillus theae]PWA11874.1 DUF1146 domain-containing protein [Pueribacillus theae]